MGYKQIVPAEPDWYFVECEDYAKANNRNQLFRRIIVWALREDGWVVGLWSTRVPEVGFPNQLSETRWEIPGVYKHISEFTVDERKAMDRGRTFRAIQSPPKDPEPDSGVEPTPSTCH